MENIYVFIYLAGQSTAVPAGVLQYDVQARIGRFTYGERYLQRADAVPVDPVALPLLPGTFEPTALNGGLYGAFRDAAPDYWGRLVIASEERCAVTALNEAKLLLRPTATRIGNLDFRLSPNDPEPPLSPPEFVQLEDLLAGVEALQREEPVAKHIQDLLLAGTSLGGARPKATVLWNNALWVAKFPMENDDYNATAVEYATMTLANRAGIDTPEMHLVDIGEKQVLMLKRFDREFVREGYERHGFISSLSLMGADEMDRERIGYPQIADELRKVGGGDTPEQLKELYRRMVFNVACRNTDDHARNHGFLIKKGVVELSPAYDITPSPAQSGVSTNFYLAIDIGQYGREASRENLLSEPGRFGLREDEATAIIAEVASVSHRWAEHFESCGLSGADIAKFVGSFNAEHLGL